MFRYLWGLGACTGSLILLRRLALIVSPYSAPPSSPNVKRSQFAVEILLGLIVPLVQVPLHFLFQGHQVNEVKDFGCIAPIYPSVPSILLVLCYPVLIDTAGTAYARKLRYCVELT